MTIVVLHGWGQDKDTWAQFVSQFPDDTIATFDLPGFGSEPLQPRWGVPEYATWVEEKIQQYTEKGPVILLGHSFGGRIAAYIASKNPQWLKALILYGAPVLYRPSLATRLTISITKAVKKIVPIKRPSQSKAMGPEVYEVFKKVVPFDLSTLLPKIAVPTFLVWGAEDSEVPVSIAKEANTLIPESTMVVLPKQGHNIHIDAPHLFYGTVKNFIETY